MYRKLNLFKRLNPSKNFCYLTERAEKVKHRTQQTYEQNPAL